MVQARERPFFLAGFLWMDRLPFLLGNMDKVSLCFKLVLFGEAGCLLVDGILDERDSASGSRLSSEPVLSDLMDLRGDDLAEPFLLLGTFKLCSVRGGFFSLLDASVCC